MKKVRVDSRPTDRPTYAIASVDNALRLLLILRDVGALRVSTAATELGVADSTAHRLLNMLVFRGFAVQGPDKQYMPGPALGVPPASSGWLRALDAIARPHLDELATATGETANLVVRVGTHIRFVYSAEGHRLLRIGDRRGHVMDAGISAAGQILLLDCAEDELRDLYLDPSTRTRDRQNSTPVTPPLTDVEFSELLTRLAAVRRSDFAVNLERTEHGVAAFGAAIRTPQGRILAAATLTMPTVRYRENLHDGTLSKLITAARAISTDLAGFGEVQ